MEKAMHATGEPAGDDQGWAGDTRWLRDERGRLLVGDRVLDDVVAEIGGTPCYLLDRGRIERRVAMLRECLPASVELHYAIKANPLPELVAWLAARVDGFDVASAGELELALAAGMSPQRISFAGPGKSASELALAHAHGVLVNVESFREIGILAELGARDGTPARVALRVNLPFELRGSGMRMSGGASPFGIDSEQVPEALAAIRAAGLAFEGFHLFAGSQCLRADAIVEAQQASYELVLGWRDLFPAPVRMLNLGSGFGIPYTIADAPLDFAPIAANLASLAARAREDFPEARLAIEPGRYLVGEAGVYVVRVIDRKVSRGQTFLVVDGGMHQHLAASGNFGQVMRRNYPVAISPARGEREIANVVGPLCTPLDLLADKAELHRAEVDDLFVVFQSGAYGRSASPRGFLSHPDVTEHIV